MLVSLNSITGYMYIQPMETPITSKHHGHTDGELTNSQFRHKHAWRNNDSNTKETTQLRRKATWEKGLTTVSRTCDLRSSAKFQPCKLWNRPCSFVPNCCLSASDGRITSTSSQTTHTVIMIHLNLDEVYPFTSFIISFTEAHN